MLPLHILLAPKCKLEDMFPLDTVLASKYKSQESTISTIALFFKEQVQPVQSNDPMLLPILKIFNDLLVKMISYDKTALMFKDDWDWSADIFESFAQAIVLLGSWDSLSFLQCICDKYDCVSRIAQLSSVCKTALIPYNRTWQGYTIDRLVCERRPQDNIDSIVLFLKSQVTKPKEKPVRSSSVALQPVITIFNSLVPMIKVSQGIFEDLDWHDQLYHRFAEAIILANRGTSTDLSPLDFILKNYDAVICFAVLIIETSNMPKSESESPTRQFAEDLLLQLLRRDMKE